MSRSKSVPVAQPSACPLNGLGIWNLYFLSKFVLAWSGHLHLQVLPNLIFALALLIPVSSALWRRIRSLVALLVAVTLLYQDAGFGPLHDVIAPAQGVSLKNLIDELAAVIDWHVCALLLLLIVGYWVLNPWLRMTTLTLLGFVWFSLGHVLTPVETPDVLQRTYMGSASQTPNSVQSTERDEVNTPSVHTKEHP